jgi:CDP-glucose 4,6-dehydratase
VNSSPLPDRRFWEGRSVLVTGHTGFKGGWLTTWLKLLGAKVVGYGLPPAGERSFYRAAAVGEGIEERFGDICDLQAVAAVIGETKPQTVFHLAAQPLVLAGYQRPHQTFAVNVLGTANVLEAAGEWGTAEVVVVTSDKCYLPKADRPHREGDPLGGHDPYSASKAGAELVVEGYRGVFRQRNGGPRLATARAGNVIGGGDFTASRLLPDLVLAARQGRPVTLRRPEAVRPWQHVLSPLLGYLLLAERLAGSERFEGGWNFGPLDGEVATVGEVVERVAALLPWPLQVEVGSAQSGEDGYLALDSAKAQRELGWQPPLGLGDALRLTVDWYREFFAGGEMATVCRQQIETFCSLTAGA